MDVKICIVIDDFHPEGYGSKQNLDFGLDWVNGPFKYVLEFLNNVKGAKVNLFTVPDWRDNSSRPTIFKTFFHKIKSNDPYEVGTFNIDNNKFRSWVKDVKKLVDEDKIRICLHGYNHYGINSHLEFENLSFDDAKRKIELAEEIFTKINLPLSKYFRPPGWKMSKEALDAICSSGFNLAPTFNFKLPFDSNVPFFGRYLPTTGIGEHNNRKIITANCYPDDINRALSIAESGGLIIIHTHITKTVLGLNAVSEDFTKSIKTIVEAIHKRGKKTHFVFLEEL